MDWPVDGRTLVQVKNCSLLVETDIFPGANAIGLGNAAGDQNIVIGGGFIDITGTVLNGNSSMTVSF